MNKKEMLLTNASNKRINFEYSLPVARVPLGDWVGKASCKDVPTDLFFPHLGQSTIEAKKVCETCPVRQPCLKYAIENKIPYGVWGGITVGSRKFSQVARQAVIDSMLVEDWFVAEYDKLNAMGEVHHLVAKLCEVTNMSRTSVQKRVRNLRSLNIRS